MSAPTAFYPTMLLCSEVVPGERHIKDAKPISRGSYNTVTEAKSLESTAEVEKEVSSLGQESIPLSVHAAYRVPDWSYERENSMRTTERKKETPL